MARAGGYVGVHAGGHQYTITSRAGTGQPQPAPAPAPAPVPAPAAAAAAPAAAVEAAVWPGHERELAKRYSYDAVAKKWTAEERELTIVMNKAGAPGTACAPPHVQLLLAILLLHSGSYIAPWLPRFA